ncbi:MAG: sigma-54 dependent transcriptional regulator [candidate division Zixibacteria bacterium]
MKILIVDDEPNILSTVGSALRRSGYDVLTAGSFDEAVGLLNDTIDVALLDVWLGDKDGIELLSFIKGKYPSIESVMISGHAEIETAVKAVKAGAFDFLEKPLSLDRIEVTFGNITRLKRLRNERDDLKKRLGESERLVGKSKSIEQLKESIARVAPEDSRVLITGENGTGKELVARLIHETSPRKDGPFIAVNCAALPDDLIESELFGYEKGAFTGAVKAKPGRFELANDGTLFLDEIAETSSKTQAKLLRAVEEGSFTRLGGTAEIKSDARLVAATNKNLKQAISDGKFREDLFYRLAVLPIELSPLRDRREDIPLLIEHFSNEFSSRRGRPSKKFDKSAMKMFGGYSYPGNIRELANYVERIVIMSSADVISGEEVERLLPHLAGDNPKGTLKAACERFERDYIKKTIESVNGNMTRASEILGIERSHLYKKMKSLGTERGGGEAIS